MEQEHMSHSIISTKKLSKADIAIIEGSRLGFYSVDVINGIVYNRKSQVLKGSINHDGYVRIKILYPDWQHPSNIFAHRIIGYAIWGDELFRWEINHINENKSDNRASNLELVTHDRNMQHSMRGSKNHITILTEDQVIEIRRRYKSHDKHGNSGRDLAKEFGTTYKNISQIIHKKSWNYI